MYILRHSAASRKVQKPPHRRHFVRGKGTVRQRCAEPIVIAQDTTRYGYDLYGEEKLSELLTHLCAIPGVHWVRVHYMYPESITDTMIDVFAREEKL